MRSLIAKIAFAVIILCLLTLVCGIIQPDSPSGTYQAVAIPAEKENAAPSQPDPDH